MTANIVISVTIIAIVLALLVLAIRERKRDDDDDDVPSRGWHRRFTPSGKNDITLQGAGFAFDFPTRPEDCVKYIQNFDKRILRVGGTMRARFTVTAADNTRFIPREFPDKQATVTLLIQRKGDDWSAKGPMQSYRWYSSQMIELRAGTFELAVPLDVQHFGDVYGGHDPARFEAALAQAESIGLVFGSAGGRGHGVYAQTPSRFELISMVQN